jgi:hypothetical protein
MADGDVALADRTARLQVAAARQEESGQGIARLPQTAFSALGIAEGDVVEITGKQVTAAIAVHAYPEDQSLEVIRRDGESVEHVTAADFDEAFADSRATVTAEMENEYAKMKGELKKRAAQVQPIGFIHEGMVEPIRDRKHD